LEFYERAQSYTNCGRASATDRYQHRMIGFNYRLTEFQAVILAAQLERLPQQAKVRQVNMNHLEKRLRGTPGLTFLARDKRQTRTAAYQYLFKYHSERLADIPRAAFLGALQMEGIPCDGLFYEPVYKSALFPFKPSEWPAFGPRQAAPIDLKTDYRCPVSERAAYEESVWLPHHIFLGSKKDTDDIGDAVLKVCANIEELRGLKHPAIEIKAMGRAERPRVEKRQW
jgi:dTDP-4-amino-4,6-dideoxygalactose transaminase